MSKKKIDVIVYGKTLREARRFYDPKPSETVAYRLVDDFDRPEKAGMVLCAGDYPEIVKAYEDAKKPKDEKPDKK